MISPALLPRQQQSSTLLHAYGEEKLAARDQATTVVEATHKNNSGKGKSTEANIADAVNKTGAEAAKQQYNTLQLRTLIYISITIVLQYDIPTCSKC